MTEQTRTKLTTTLELLRKNNACRSGYKKLLKHLGEDYPRDTEINLLTVLESNGVSDMIWCLRATVQPIEGKVLSLMAADFAESVLHIYESEYPENKSVRLCIEAVRLFAAGKVTLGDLRKARLSAADAAAYAYSDAAAYAAYAAAYAAYSAYAASCDDAAAVVAADTAVYAADVRKEESKKQAAIIKKYLKENVTERINNKNQEVDGATGGGMMSRAGNKAMNSVNNSIK